MHVVYTVDAITCSWLLGATVRSFSSQWEQHIFQFPQMIAIFKIHSYRTILVNSLH